MNKKKMLLVFKSIFLSFALLFGQPTDCDIFGTLSKDLDDTEGLLSVLEKGENMKAWDFVKAHPQIRVHVKSLEKISSLLGDANFISKLPNGKADLTDIIAATKNPLNGGTASNLVKLEDHLENVRQVVTKHSNADGFSRLMTDLKNPAFPMQDGASHMLNDVKNFPEGSVKKFDYEFDGDGVACTRCRFDVELKSGSPRFL